MNEKKNRAIVNTPPKKCDETVSSSKESLRFAMTEKSAQAHELHKNPGGKISEKIRRCPFYAKSLCVFVSPHPLLHQTCLNILADQKLLILPSPKIQTGFYALSPHAIPVRQRQIVLRRLGGKNPLTPKIDYTRGPEKKIDLLLTAPLTAGVDGSMLADGQGHFDLQYAILDTLGWLTADAGIAALLADDFFLRLSPIDTSDILAHHVVTPTQTIKTHHHGRQKSSINWANIGEKQGRRNDALFFLKKRASICLPVKTSDYPDKKIS